MLRHILGVGILSLGTGMSWGDAGFVTDVDAGSWPHDRSGSAVLAITSVDISPDLDARLDLNDFAYLVRVPRVSNVHVDYAAVAVSGDSALPRGIDFNGVTFPVSTEVGSDIDLTQVDGVVYAELSNAGASLDIGMALRYLEGAVDMIDTHRGERAAFDGVVPLVFGKARIVVWRDVYAAAEVGGMTADEDRVFEAGALIGWVSQSGVGIQTGYRSYRLKLTNYDQLDRLDVDVAGPYASVEFHF